MIQQVVPRGFDGHLRRERRQVEILIKRDREGFGIKVSLQTFVVDRRESRQDTPREIDEAVRFLGMVVRNGGVGCSEGTDGAFLRTQVAEAEPITRPKHVCTNFILSRQFTQNL
jgi:hypothetical protein